MPTDTLTRQPATAQDLQTLLQAVRTGAALETSSSSAAPAIAAQRLRPRAGGGLVAVRGDERSRAWRPRRSPKGSSEGQVIYAVGDVHGRLDLLEALLSRIEKDAAGRPHLLIFCGDYVDRGPDSARVLERLLCLQERRGACLHLLKGNHEQAFLRFIDEPAWAAPWLERFGGGATLAAYGVAPPDLGASPEELTAARDRLLANMPASHLRLLQRLDVMVVLGDYAFVHAGVAPGTPLAEQTEDALLWSRSEFLAAQRPFEKIIVHGHSWNDDQPQILPHRIGLDTGAYETGVLTAVRIEDHRREAIQALDEAATRRHAAQQAERVRPLVSLPADYARTPPYELQLRFENPAFASSHRSSLARVRPATDPALAVHTAGAPARTPSRPTPTRG